MQLIAVQRLVYIWACLYLVIASVEAKGGRGGGGGGGGRGSSGGGSRGGSSGGSSGGRSSGSRTTGSSSIGSGYRSNRGVSSSGSYYKSVPTTNTGKYTYQRGLGGGGYIGSGSYRPRGYYIGSYGYYGYYPYMYPFGYGHYYPYCGYDCRYGGRYNDNNSSSYYYARPYDTAAGVLNNNSTGPVVISTIRNDGNEDGGDIDNRLQFIFSAAKYPSVRSTYYDTSASEIAAPGTGDPGDFTLGLTLYRLIEYADVDGDSVYTDGKDTQVRYLDLSAAAWSPFAFTQKTAGDRDYYESTIRMTALPTSADGTRSNVTASPATVTLTFRTANAVINTTETLNPTIPNSAGIDMAVTGFGLSPNSPVKLALIVLIRTAEVFGQDPDLPSNQGNRTKGVQAGDAAGARVEWSATGYATSTNSISTRVPNLSVTGSQPLFNNATLPQGLNNAEDDRITRGRPEATYAQVININLDPAAAAGAPLAPNTTQTVSLVSFLDEQVLTPENGGMSSRGFTTLTAAVACFATMVTLFVNTYA
ncbi:uncharacterized protein EV422DRAFT_524306 [Fimicolochytrium jonesii]|uniref:uncharacterized protein n=1 Tax=Fimicolochytrium jonesii TaxID=1396493 RepID=UPI0022FE9520|nr:uncharacterized protein EV422DRAFT_524306 [Fimicolochytrium jonesii]KAI8822517.1 hypothetical protein EV422DRAFT_524306 [Fimicolochytrium jonesii]